MGILKKVECVCIHLQQNIQSLNPWFEAGAHSPIFYSEAAETGPNLWWSEGISSTDDVIHVGMPTRNSWSQKSEAASLFTLF